MRGLTYTGAVSELDTFHDLKERNKAGYLTNNMRPAGAAHRLGSDSLKINSDKHGTDGRLMDMIPTSLVVEGATAPAVTAPEPIHFL